MKNIYNRIFTRFYRKSVKFNLQLNRELKEIIFGLMLGDLFSEKKMTIVTQDYNLNNLLRIRNIFYIYFKF
jgi:hypothetical protein